MKLIPYLGVACLVALSGCSSIAGGPEPVITANEEVSTLKPLFDSTNVSAYFYQRDQKERRVLRDQIISARLYAADVRFSEYTQSLTQELRSGAFGADLTSILLSGIASVSDPGQKTKIMAGLDTALKGGRQAFTKEILIDRTLPILITQMRSDRKVIATEIWNNLNKFDDRAYPLPLALSHLNEYYHAGTVVGALTSIGDNIASISIEKEQEVANNNPNIPDVVSSKKTINPRKPGEHSSYGQNELTEAINSYLDKAPNYEEALKHINSIAISCGMPMESDASLIIDAHKEEYRDLQRCIVKELSLTN